MSLEYGRCRIEHHIQVVSNEEHITKTTKKGDYQFPVCHLAYSVGEHRIVWQKLCDCFIKMV